MVIPSFFNSPKIEIEIYSHPLYISLKTSFSSHPPLSDDLGLPVFDVAQPVYI